jgi:hypothetical protein
VVVVVAVAQLLVAVELQIKVLLAVLVKMVRLITEQVAVVERVQLAQVALLELELEMVVTAV